MEELLVSIVKGLVEDPDAVNVTASTEEALNLCTENKNKANITRNLIGEMIKIVDELEKYN